MTFSTTVDPDLLAAARCGARPAQESLYRMFERPVWTLALRLTDQRADAEEVAQDAFLKAFQALPRYRAEAPFGMWLRQIVVNEALMRRRNRMPVLEMDEERQAGSDDGRLQPGAFDLARCLNALPQPTRGVLWLYYVEGYTHPEIASAYGQSVSFSKSQVSRGAERIRQSLGEPGARTQEAYA